jgi:hypothetical protein
MGAYEPPLWIDVPFQGLIVRVGAHALRANVGGRLLRLPVSYEEVVAICNRLQWIPPTFELSDRIWEAATVKIDYVPQDPSIMLTLRAVEQMNKEMDARLAGKPWGELTATEGKDWIVSPRDRLCSANNPHAMGAANYGWHHLDGTMVQTRGDDDKPPPHDIHHWDYSQTLRPIQRMARRPDGTEVNLISLYSDLKIPASVLAAFLPS